MKRSFLIFMALLLCYACDDIIEVEDISDAHVTVLAPVNDSVLNTQELSFSWQSVEDAQSYHIQVARPSFQEAEQIVIDSTITGTSFEASLDFESYQWRIRGENSDYQTAYTTQSFTIEEQD